jgi:hypothetical protein
MSNQAMRDEVERIMEETPPNSAGWVRANCPWCEELGHHSRVKNLAINPETGYFKCWRSFHCGTVGFLWSKDALTYSAAYVPVIAPSLADIIAKRIGPSPADLEGFQRIDVKAPGLGLPYYTYLKKRRVSDKAITATGCGYCLGGQYKDRLVIPFVQGGEYVGAVTRVLYATGYAYKNSPGFVRDSMFNIDALFVETEEPIAIVEGVFDALPHWPYAVACLGKPTDRQVDIIARAKRPVVMLLDGDARLENRSTLLRLQLRGANVRAAYLPPATDPGDLSVPAFIDYLLGENQ